MKILFIGYLISHENLQYIKNPFFFDLHISSQSTFIDYKDIFIIYFFGRHLSEYGKIAKKYWEYIPHVYENVFLDEYIIMPNHMHGIIHIDNIVGNIVGADIIRFIKNHMVHYLES